MAGGEWAAAPGAAVPAERFFGTYRVYGVVVTGCAWILVGTLAVLGGVTLAAAARPWAQAAVLVLAGLLLIGCGLSFLLARIEVTAGTVVSYWGLRRTEHAVDDLVAVSVEEPRTRSFDWVPGSQMNPLFFVGTIINVVVRVLVRTVEWTALPGTTNNQVLHLVPRLGSAVPLRAISARRADNPDVYAAAYAVDRVIVQHLLRTGADLTGRIPEREGAPDTARAVPGGADDGLTPAPVPPGQRPGTGPR